MATYKQTELVAIGKKITSVDARLTAEALQATKFTAAQTASLTKFKTKSDGDIAKLTTERTQLIAMREYLNGLAN